MSLDPVLRYWPLKLVDRVGVKYGAAAKAEARKNAAYTAALDRHAERFGSGEWFVPLSFEISGTWGWGSGHGYGSYMYSRRAASWQGASVTQISSTGVLWNLWDTGGSA
jgi:hypothetical protein